MTETQELRRRTDGSIDTGYYLALGRGHRSEAAHMMTGKALKQSGGVLTSLSPWPRCSRFSGDRVKKPNKCLAWRAERIFRDRKRSMD